MAGYGTILGAAMFDAYAGHVLNTHPALLPSFKGWHAVEDALAYGVKITGCTVHIATAQVDAGPILAQAAVPVLPGDTPEALAARVLVQEHAIYPLALALLASGRTGLAPDPAAALRNPLPAAAAAP